MGHQSTVSERDMSSRRRSRRRRLAIAILMLLAVLAGTYAAVPRYALRATQANSWHNVPFNQSSPRGTQITVCLDNRFANHMANAELIIEQLQDSTGKNLMIDEVPA